MIIKPFDELKPLIRTGDMLAFSGDYADSKIIRFITHSEISHVATFVVDGDMIYIVESISGEGVRLVSAGQKLADYRGRVCLMRYAERFHAVVGLAVLEMLDWLNEQIGKPYDIWQSIEAGLDDMFKFMINMTPLDIGEDLSQYFCSELVTAALLKLHILHAVNPSETTPIDLCMFRIWENHYYQIGKEGDEPLLINGYNLLEPDGFGYTTIPGGCPDVYKPNHKPVWPNRACNGGFIGS